MQFRHDLAVIRKFILSSVTVTRQFCSCVCDLYPPIILTLYISSTMTAAGAINADSRKRRKKYKMTLAQQEQVAISAPPA